MGFSKKHKGENAIMRHVLCLAAVILTAMTFAGCRRADDRVPTAVHVTTLRRETIVSATRFSATVREHQRIELSFKVPGTVASLMQVKGLDGRLRDIQEGDAVVADSANPLARLDDSDYKRHVAAAQDRLAAVQAKQRAVAANVTAAKATFDRVKGLRERGSVAQQMFDDVLAKRDAAVAELEAVQREIGGAGVAVQQADDDLSHCSLRLPIAKAVISRKSIERGERVPAGQPVIEVMDLSTVRVAFGVSDKQIGGFTIGRAVTVTADAFPSESFSGRVTKVQPAADLRTRTFEVEVTIIDPKRLKPGMIVTIIVGKREDVVLIPMTAVQRGGDEDEFTVFAITEKDGQCVARKRRVRLDGVYDNRVCLVEDPSNEVKLGDKIVSGGAFRIADGQTVRVLEVPDLAEQFDNR
jgi:RND family efflux transporter MFP subunit